MRTGQWCGDESRGSRGPEAAEPTSQSVRFGLQAESKGEPRSSPKLGKHLVRTISWKENCDHSLGCIVNKIQSEALSSELSGARGQAVCLATG